MRVSGRIVVILILLSTVIPAVLLPTANSQSYSTVTSTSTATTVISNTQTNSYAIGTSTSSSTYQNSIYSGSFRLTVTPGSAGGSTCGEYEYVPFQATAGEQIEVTVNSTLEVDFYIVTAHDFNASGLNAGKGGGCTVAFYEMTIPSVKSKAFNFTAQTTGKYYFIVELLSYTNVSTNVALDAYSISTETYPFTIFSSTTYVAVATLTETLTSAYTQQVASAAEGTNNDLLIGILVAVVVVAVAAAYLMSQKKKSTKADQKQTVTPITKTTEPTQPKPPPQPSEIKPESKSSKYCRKCGATIPRDSVFCEECGTKLT
jgi:ribosomal protein L40E